MQGSCLCGAIRFEASGKIGGPTACHCTQCRKQTGHYWTSLWAYDENLTITGTPQWYAASASAKRGFCPTCGAFLFWKADKDSWTCFSAGAVDGDTGMTLTRHIYTHSAGDYYTVPKDQSA